MKKILISVLGILSVVVYLAFSSYSVNAASNEWSWPLGKPYAGRYEEGQQFGNTTFNRGGTHFHDGFDFGYAIYGNGSVYSVHDGKILYAGWDPVGGGSLGAFIVLGVSAPTEQKIPIETRTISNYYLLFVFLLSD